MELMTPSSHTNPLLFQNLPSHLPSPFPSSPSSPLTPPINFKTTDDGLFDRAPDYSHLKFPPINAPAPAFSSDNSIFCTVSAPSTPASDRKCIDKFCINETNNESQRGGSDKKKAKRVSIVNTKDDEKVSETQEAASSDGKDADGKDKKLATDANNGNHHSHMHRNHSHTHPKRRMSLDNTLVRDKEKLVENC